MDHEAADFGSLRDSPAAAVQEMDAVNSAIHLDSAYLLVRIEGWFFLG